MLVQLLLDAQAAGALAPAPPVAPTSKRLRADLDRLAEAFADVPEAVVVRALVAWSAIVRRS